MSNNETVDQIYQQIRPGDLDDDTSIMVLDWSFRLGMPSIDSLWVIDDGAYFPITGPDCFICLFKGVFEVALENEQTLEVCESVRMFLLAVINHKSDGDFPDEYYYYSGAKLLDVIITDSSHEDGE